VPDAGAESNAYLEQQLRESMETVSQLKHSLHSVKTVSEVKLAVKANEPQVDATAKSVQRLQATPAPATSTTTGSLRGSRAAAATVVASRDQVRMSSQMRDRCTSDPRCVYIRHLAR